MATMADAINQALIGHRVVIVCTVRVHPRYRTTTAPTSRRLTDAKIADVLTYVRSDWGNTAPTVSPEGIAFLRKELAGRSESFTQADLEAVPSETNLPAGDQPPVAKVDAPAVVQVMIRNMKFDPPNLEVKKGDVVEWKNDDITPHTATSTTFDSASIDPDKSWRHTFTDAGNFPYTCTFHPDMKAVVVVK